MKWNHNNYKDSCQQIVGANDERCLWQEDRHLSSKAITGYKSIHHDFVPNISHPEYNEPAIPMTKSNAEIALDIQEKYCYDFEGLRNAIKEALDAKDNNLG
jgi:hypothetical protein